MMRRAIFAITLCAAAVAPVSAEKPLEGGHWSIVQMGQTRSGGVVFLFVRDDGKFISRDGIHNFWMTMVPDQKATQDLFIKPTQVERFLYKINCEDRKHQIASLRVLDNNSVTVSDIGDQPWTVSDPTDSLYYKIDQHVCHWT